MERAGRPGLPEARTGARGRQLGGHQAEEDASLCVLLLAEIFHDVFPPGVVNVITGLGEERSAPAAFARLLKLIIVRFI